MDRYERSRGGRQDGLSDRIADAVRTKKTTTSELELNIQRAKRDSQPEDTFTVRSRSYNSYRKRSRWSTWDLKKKVLVVMGFVFIFTVIGLAVATGIFMHYTNLLDRNGTGNIHYNPKPVNESELVDESDTFDADEKEKELKEQLAQQSRPISNEKVMNILLIGEDIRDTETEDRGNTDVMMIISINHEQRTITMTSLMRDMYIYMSEFNDSGKLNSAYWHGGAEYLKDVIQDYFGIEIDRYVKVNFRQFIDIVEAVGGLDLEVSYAEAKEMDHPLGEQNKYLNYPKKTDYIDLSKYDDEDDVLKLHLNGNQALAYARIRYNVGDDYGRTQRQRIVITEIIKASKKLNLFELDALMNKVFPYVQTDITDAEIASLLLNAFDYMNYSTQQLRIPVDGYFYDDFIWNQAVLNPDYQANAAFLRYIIYGEATNAEEAVEIYQQKMADGSFWQELEEYQNN